MRRRARATMAGAAAGAAPEAAAAAARADRAAAAGGRPPRAPAPLPLLLLLLLCAARASTGAALPGPGPSPTPSAASATALASTPAQPQGLLCDWALCNCTFAGQTRVIARCRLPKNQDVEIAPGALPAWLMELHVEGGAAVRVQAGAFSAVRDVRLLNVSGAGSVVVRRHAFLNVSSQHVFVHAADCAAVVLESHAFRAPAGPASLEVRRCGHVVVQSAAFAWLLRAHLRGVVRLELASNAFALEQPDGRRHGPAPSVVLERVMLAELPPLAFPSQVAEVRLVEAQVRAVRRDAFYALQLSAVAVVNSSLQQVDAGAFSARTLVLQLSVQGSRVGRLASGALRGAVGNLSIVDSQVETVEAGAVDITVAKVALEQNSVGAVGERGFAFAKWNSLVVRGNAFRELRAHALWAPFQHMSGVDAYEVRWQDNNVTDLQPDALAAVADAARRAREDARGQLVVEVSGLRLEAACRCDLRARLLGGEAALAAAATCRVDAALARCLGVLREGRAAALEYEARVCDQSERVLVCEAAPTARGGGGGGGGALDELPPPSAAADTPDRGRKVLALVFAAVVLGSLLVLAASGALWLHRKGYCRGAGRWAPPASAASCLAQVARLWAARGARHRAPAATATAAAATAGGSPRAHAHHAAPAAHYTELRRGDPAAADADDPDEVSASATIQAEGGGRRRGRRGGRGQVDADAARGADAGAAAGAAREARRPRQLQRGARHDRAPLRPHQGRGKLQQQQPRERRGGRRRGLGERRGVAGRPGGHGRRQPVRGHPAARASRAHGRHVQRGHARAVARRPGAAGHARGRAGLRLPARRHARPAAVRVRGAARPRAAPLRRAAGGRGRARRRLPAARVPPAQLPALARGDAASGAAGARRRPAPGVAAAPAALRRLLAARLAARLAAARARPPRPRRRGRSRRRRRAHHLPAVRVRRAHGRRGARVLGAAAGHGEQAATRHARRGQPSRVSACAETGLAIACARV